MSWTRHARAGVWAALAVLLGSGLVSAGQAASGTTQIRGRVRNASDNAPIARARVLAQSDQSPDPHVAITGADGTYILDNVAPGSYTVTVTRTGFAPQAYGQGRQAAATPVAVAAGQQVAVDVTLVPARTIAGRILDEDGTPFAGAIVEALVLRQEGGPERLVSAAVAETDDRGEFRLFGLAPGAYYVSAADPAFRTVTTKDGAVRYSPTYYPGVAAADQARAIPVGGSDPPRVEFKLKLVPPARLSGMLVADNGRRLLNAAIVLSPRQGEGVPTGSQGSPTLNADGMFTIANVAPGPYQIFARGQTDAAGIALFGVFSVELQGEDIGGIELALHPGAVIEGIVSVHAVTESKAPVLSTLRVRAPFTDGTGFGDSLTGTVQPDGSFGLRGVMEGSHQFVVEGLPSPWIVKSVQYRGSDVTDRAFDVAQKERFRDVRITITDASSVVAGTVTNAQQRPVADAGVLVFPTVPLFWMRTDRRMRIAYTDAEGRFTLHGLPPGEYVAVASMSIQESDLGRHERLRALQPIGTAFRVESDAGHTSLALRLAGGSAASRPGPR